MSKRRFATICASIILAYGPALIAQNLPYEQAVPQPVANVSLSAQQLDSIVAPIALYPDPLLSQVLVAASYPLQIIEAAQWLQQNPGLSGRALENAASQQNWDPSVQALVLFPDALRVLSENVQWTTTLGNAFLSQQADLMDSVQRMRIQAQSAGSLNSTPQIAVSSQPVAGAPPAVVIQPANPQVMYVPVYDPLYIWGQPAYPYPVLWYPRPYVGRRVLFGPGVTVAASFGVWGGWTAWGWGPNWGGRTVVVNNAFFTRYGYRTSVPAYRHPAIAYAPAARNPYMGRPAPVVAAPHVAAFASPKMVTSGPVVRNSYVAPPRIAQEYRPASSGRAPALSRGGESRGNNHSSSRHR